MLEMIISLAIIAVMFAVILPQFKNIQNSWASKQATAEAIQNGRILVSYLNQNLTKAAQITAVSDPCDTTGYIEFVGNDAVTYRCEIGADNIVEFGPVGSLVDLAGPVSQLQFTCYALDDLDTAITDVDSIRLVKVETKLTNSAPLGQDQNFTASAYLRTNWNPCLSLVGWWKLNETSGLTAADGSSKGNDGTLTNMAGDEWANGVINGALEFFGGDDYIAIAHADDFLIDNGTMSLWFNANNVSSRGELFSKDSQFNDTGGHLTVYVESSCVTARLQSTNSAHYVSSANTLQVGTWYHVALCWGSEGMKFYLNGLEVDTDPYTGGLGTTSGGIGNYEPLALGACTWISGDLVITPLVYYFDGTLDDVRIYNHVLNAEEIAALADPDRVILREFTETKVDTDVPSITLSTPAGTSEGDLMIAAVVTDGETTTQILPPGGEGWTEIDLDESGNAVTLGVWWKLADALESPTHQFTWTNNFQQAYGLIMRFTGHDSSSPINASSTNVGNSSTPISPSVTTTVANTLILRLGAFDDDDVIVGNTGLSGHTEITMDKSSSSGNTCSGGAGYVQQAAIGDSGTSNFSLTAGEQHLTVTVAIASNPQSSSDDCSGAEILP